MEIIKYFETIEQEVKKAYEIANRARKIGCDPEKCVDIPVAKNIFERVEGLIGADNPQLIGSGLAKRLEELDKKYGSGDWRVGLVIAEEVAKQNFGKFKDEREAMEVGIRVGLAYLTMGVVSAPLEGFIEFKIKDRNDGGKYASAYFAGPIRAAGGTAAAVSLLLADYVRRKFNIGSYDITDAEIARYIGEIDDYHEKVARLQYFPNKEELFFLLKHIPIEINGDPTSQREVLVNKDLPRVGTPCIRGGMCLVLCEGLAGKAAKILKNIQKWGKEFGLEEWEFLKEYIEIKTRVHAGESKKDILNAKITPNTTFIEETVAGRPTFSYPMAKGGFRIRYGRTRLSGLAAAGINPATTRILGDFIATGAQLRWERPGKACVTTPCTTIDGPIVKLIDESVIQINSEDVALAHRNYIKEILFTGDILIPYGEFARNNHVLVPSPYVEEWWIQELMQAAGTKIEFNENEPLQLLDLSIKYKIPLHPSMIYFYADVSVQDLFDLFDTVSKSNLQKTIDSYKIQIPHDKKIKKILEDICIPHKLLDYGIVIEGKPATGLLVAFGYLPNSQWKTEKAMESKNSAKTSLEFLNGLSEITIKNKTGVYLGARLGRPEKAKMRKLNGKPQVLFPVGLQGGRMRSLNEAVEKGFVEAEFPNYFCNKCNSETIFRICPICKSETDLKKVCIKCNKETPQDYHCGMETAVFRKRKFELRQIFNESVAKLKISLPSLIKGVRGTYNKIRVPEPIEKGILRAIHDVYVNKDGTIRYDAIEAPVTHFKPKEIGTNIAKLKELGYEKDIFGNPLERDDQILELLPQDIILPDCKEWPEASALESINKICNFVDDLLVRYYNQESYYNIKSASDIIGHLTIVLAPHTSAGIVGRIIGFSKTQCFFAHPYLHSACRRNCDGDELCFMMLMDALLNFSRQFLPDRRGGRSMDSPLVLTTRLDPQEVDDEVYNMDIVDIYPLSFYEATQEWKSPYDIKIKQIKDNLGKPEQYYGILYTHPTDSMNHGCRISAYKTLTTVFDKIQRQMELAERIRAVDKSDMAKTIIEKHFLKDIKGNLRKFSTQEFRCINCNQKYRRVPLAGRCTKCQGKLVLTVAEGTVSKYLEPCLNLTEKYKLPNYLRQTLDILKRSVDSMFGKEPTKQVNLKNFFS